VNQLHALRIGPPPKFEPIGGSEFTIEADLVLLAMGFLGPVKNGMIEQLGVALDPRGNVATDGDYMSSVPGVFAAAICAAASRWWSGPSPKAAKPPKASTASSPAPPAA